MSIDIASFLAAQAAAPEAPPCPVVPIDLENAASPPMTPACPPVVPATVQEPSATSRPRQKVSESNQNRFCQRAVTGILYSVFGLRAVAALCLGVGTAATLFGAGAGRAGHVQARTTPVSLSGTETTRLVLSRTPPKPTALTI